jgi:aryl-phospho-beta-D-glucosidase BglC (GH1 family)
MFDSGSTPNTIDFGQNPDLQGKKPIEILDILIQQAGARGLRIILDRHRPDANAQSALWYTAQYSEQRWIADWTMLATRYRNNSTVVGFDLHNEPNNPATWGDGNMMTDWRAAAERAGTAIQAVHPDILIIVEGVQEVNGQYYWNGGNLLAAGSAPVQLPTAARVVYSPHDYPASVYGQPWFSAANYPNNLPGVWDMYWGYLVKQNLAPVWIGEYGTKLQTSSDTMWLTSLVSYIKTYQLNTAFWCWNPDSGDTGGILQDDWLNVNQNKIDAIKPGLAPPL